MKKMEQFQALRAIAYISIFLSHCGITKFGGAWGVSIFIILSGFLMSYNYVGKSDELCSYNVKKCLQFSVAKINKLYPLHLIMTLVALPMLLINIGEKVDATIIGKTIFKFLSNILLIQSWFPQQEFRYSMNNLSWYLCVCVLLYFCFPYIIRIMKKYKNASTAIGVSVIAYAVMVIVGTIICSICYKENIDAEIVKGLTYNFPVYRLGEFLIGCNIGYLFVNRIETNKKYYSVLEIAALIVIIISFIISTRYSEDAYNTWWRTTVLYTWSTAFLVYLLAVNKGIISKIINNKVLVYIGDLSAYTYLIHEMPIRYLNKFTSSVYKMWIDKWLMALIMFPIALIAAFVWKKYLKDKIIMKGLQIEDIEKLEITKKC